MSTLAERPEIAGGVISHANGLEIANELSFNEWRRLGERLLATTDRALWSLGDWRLYGERFAKDYHEGLTKIDESSRLIAPALRVAGAFRPDRRRDQLSFEFHAVVAALEEPEQERWLNDAERQGWSARQMQLEFAGAIERVQVSALSFRLVEDYYRIAVTAAARRDMDPKEWVLEAIREKVDREAPELEAA